VLFPPDRLRRPGKENHSAMKRTRLPALVLFVLLSAGPARAQDLVRLGNLKFAHYGAVSYMKELAPRWNLKIEERLFPKGVDIMPAIVAGEIDAAASAAEAAIAGRGNGAPIYLVAGFARGGARIVAGVDSGIRSIPDLKGKRVGVTRGGTQELLLLAQLEKHRITWSDRPGKDVRIIYLAYADLNQALAAKQIDAMCQSEPQSSQIINKKLGREVNKPYDTPMGEPVRALVITEKLYRERRPVAERFLQLFVAATSAFLADRALAESYTRNQLFKGQLSSQDYADAMSNAVLTVDVSVQHIAVTTELMQKFGVGRMARPPRAEDWVKLDLLEKAKAQRTGKP
jgi:NitT/TauT family transport system substrate-binding protein